MKTLTIDKNSWHYRVATDDWYGNTGEWEINGLCDYVRAIMWGIVKILFYIGAIGFVGGCVVAAAIGIFETITVGDFQPSGYQMFGFGLLAIIGLLSTGAGILWVGCWFGHRLIKVVDNGVNKIPETVTSKVGTAWDIYYAIVNKYCVKVNFK